MIKRKRILYGLLIIGIMLLGIATRKLGVYLPTLVNEYGGDILWALMIYLMFGFIWTSAPIKKVAIGALIFCYIIECSQLYQANWINHIRATTLGALALGHGFLTSDLICYAIGICSGLLSEALCFRNKNTLRRW